MEYVAKAAPDGYTILVAGEAGVTFNKYMYSKLPYDSIRDFEGISRLIEINAFLAVPTSAGQQRQGIRRLDEEGRRENELRFARHRRSDAYRNGMVQERCRFPADACALQGRGGGADGHSVWRDACAAHDCAEHRPAHQVRQAEGHRDVGGTAFAGLPECRDAERSRLSDSIRLLPRAPRPQGHAGRA